MREPLEFGVDWYPEQWDPSKWEGDADRMREFGVSVVRIMEFAWSVIEPEEGRYEFGLFDRAIDVLARRGIRVVLGTPTATFPAWLADRGPSVLMTFPDGTVRDHGTRRMGCWNSPAYREAALRLVTVVAERWGRDRRVEGWQVDNEIGHEGSDRCVCDNCRAAWARWLEARHGSVDALNAAWGTVFWGTTYSRFDQVPVPRRQVSSGFNPGLLLDYDRFMSDSAAAFVDAQTGILRPRLHPDAWITTNLFPPPLSIAVDMERLTRDMEFASWDNYPQWGSQEEPYPPQFQAFAESYVRGLRGNEPFTVMEQFSGFQGHVALGPLPPEEQVALWTTQAIARGANRIVYFRWRTAPYGQEQLCYGLFDSDDRETRRARVLHENAKRCRAELSRLASVPVESEACLLYSKDDARVLREQYLSEGLLARASEWSQAGYDVELARWYAPFAVHNVGADVRSVGSVDLDRYRLVALPLYQMADPAFVARLDEWVARGGILVLGYRAGARDLRDWNVTEPLPGLFAGMAGIRVPRFESLGKGEARLSLRGAAGLLPTRGRVWADLVEPAGATVEARWSDRRKHWKGRAAVTRNAHGHGAVWYVGTSPDPLLTLVLWRRILRDAGLSPRFLGRDVELVERRDRDGQRVRIALNHSPRPRRVLGRRLGPWDWAVIE